MFVLSLAASIHPPSAVKCLRRSRTLQDSIRPRLRARLLQIEVLKALQFIRTCIPSHQSAAEERKSANSARERVELQSAQLSEMGRSERYRGASKPAQNTGFLRWHLLGLVYASDLMWDVVPNKADENFPFRVINIPNYQKVKAQKNISLWWFIIIIIITDII